MKKFRYIIIIVTVALVFFVKNKIDARNQQQQDMLDNLDDGTTKPLSK